MHLDGEHQERTKVKAPSPPGRYDGAMSTNNQLSDRMPGLAADGPDPELGEAGHLFAPLIGDWRMRTTLMPLNEPPVEMEGFWSFRWGLGGRAVYDVIGFRAAGSPEDAPTKNGLTVRFYDATLATWRQVWVGVPRGDVIEFTARRDGSRILIEGGMSATLRLRWTFERITATEFAWEGRTSTDGGGTWRLEQTINGER
jgi:hypothetical protein